MKRFLNEYIEDTTSKMSKTNSDGIQSLVELRFLIPSKAAGIIIGKGGENIRELRDQFELKVNIADSPGPERVLEVSGRQKSVFDALEQILTKIQECIPASEAEYYTGSARSKRGSTRSVSNSNGVNSAEDFTVASTGYFSDKEGVDLRMLVHQSLAGGIIGRGGERIRELREQVNLHTLKLYQVVCPESTDRVVQMVDEVPKVLHCLHAIVDLLAQQALQIRGSQHPYDAHNADEKSALSYGGWLCRSSFRTLVECGPQSFSNNAATSNAATAAALVSNAARMGLINPAAAMMAAAAAAFPKQSWAPMGGGVGGGANPGPPLGLNRPGGGAGGGGGHLDLHAQQHFEQMRQNNLNLLGVGHGLDESVKSVQVSVPNSYMGSIMGRGGSRIRSVREESGADIRVYEADKNGGDRIIDITGTQTQINYAQQLLKSCVLLYHTRM